MAEDGRELYLQSFEFDPVKASGWVRENVLSHLKVCHVSGKWNVDPSLYSWQRCEKPDCPWRTLSQIKLEILAFMDIKKYGTPELWGYYSAYDHVAFCQLFGTMMDLPKGFPMYTRDLKQWHDALGAISNPSLPEQEVSEHHALADARHHWLIWRILKEYEDAKSK